MFSTNTGTIQPAIDGVNTTNIITDNSQVKNGSAPSTTAHSAARNLTKKYQNSCAHDSGNTYTISDTRAIKTNQRIILYDGTNFEEFTATAIVVDTSFQTIQTPSLIVPANVTLVIFAGFHTIDLTMTNNADYAISCFEYEPLPIHPSNFKRRVFRRKLLESKTINFRGLTNGQAAYYPIHSDGVQGNWNTSSIDVTQSSSGVYAIQEDLKDISVTGNIDLKVTSKREVFEDIDGMERY